MKIAIYDNHPDAAAPRGRRVVIAMSEADRECFAANNYRAAASWHNGMVRLTPDETGAVISKPWNGTCEVSFDERKEKCRWAQFAQDAPSAMGRTDVEAVWEGESLYIEMPTQVREARQYASRGTGLLTLEQCLELETAEAQQRARERFLSQFPEKMRKVLDDAIQ